MKKWLLVLLLTAQMLLIPASALAQTAPGCGPGGNQYFLGVPLGSISSVPRGEQAFRCYVIALYGYILGLAIILAAIVATYAGYLYLTAGGDPAKITHSRELIVGSLSGLALLILTATIVRFMGTGSGP